MIKWLERFERCLENLIQRLQVNSSISHGIRRSLEATVIRACRKCQAPGVDKDNKYVGETCPNCGAKRPPLENLGEIWTKTI